MTDSVCLTGAERDFLYDLVEAEEIRLYGRTNTEQRDGYDEAIMPRSSWHYWMEKNHYWTENQ